MEKVQYEFRTAIGSLYLVASPEGLNAVYFDQEEEGVPLVKKLDEAKPAHRTIKQTAQQLKEYFAGKRKSFDLVFALSGTSFQKQVWQELYKIPFGVTVSYKDIARRIKNPQAMRAVGSANGKNPVCIIIPCHRVIAADGTLGGYSSGLERKRYLLKHEKISVAD